MEKKILLPVDGSERGFEAVSTMGQLMKDQPGVELVLFHCVQQLAKLMPGELCLDVEETCRLPYNQQEKVGNAVIEQSMKRLIESGFPKDRIQSKLKLDSLDPSRDIIAAAEAEGIRTIALGRRGKSQLESLLLGGVSSKVAQYAKHSTIWIVDTPLHQTQKALLAMQGAPDSKALTAYASNFLAQIPGLKFTFLHLMPPVPPTFWDDGHILAPSEHKDRQSRIEKWASDWVRRVEGFMVEARASLVERGVPERKIETLILPTKEGVARDLLNEIEEHQFRIVVMGKKSFHERKPFLLGSHANKILQNVKGSVLCLVDS